MGLQMFTKNIIIIIIIIIPYALLTDTTRDTQGIKGAQYALLLKW